MQRGRSSQVCREARPATASGAQASDPQAPDDAPTVSSPTRPPPDAQNSVTAGRGRDGRNRGGHGGHGGHGGRGALTSEEKKQREVHIMDVVAERLQAIDADQRLEWADYNLILYSVVDTVREQLDLDNRRVVDANDRAFIQNILTAKVQSHLTPPKRRYGRSDRLVCMLGGDVGWAAGTILSVNVDDPGEPGTVLPYVVKLDPPRTNVISVPSDRNGTCRAEVCFGQRAEALNFTLACWMQQKPDGKPRRFAIGARVACAVEDASNQYTDWAAGTVVLVNRILSQSTAGLAACVPYEVKLDKGPTVLVHRDDHYLVRDLMLQPEGPRHAADGTRCVSKFSKRKKGDEWEIVDHLTQVVRPSKTEPNFE